MKKPPKTILTVQNPWMNDAILKKLSSVLVSLAQLVWTMHKNM